MKSILSLLLPVLLLTGCVNSKKMAPPYQVKEKNMTELRDGVKLYVVRKGKGEMPDVTDQLKVHYHGMLEDGSVFDSSFDRGEPITFPLNRLITGWQIGLVEVPVGSKVRLVIPPEQGYGARELPGIPANSTLIFDIELLSIETES